MPGSEALRSRSKSQARPQARISRGDPRARSGSNACTLTHSPLMPRVLAIDPTTNGFAYAVFEGSDFLLDWGLTQVRPEEKNALCMKRIDALIARYLPDVLVLEDCDGKGSRRNRRVRSLIRGIQRLAAKRSVRTRAFSRGQVREVFASLGRPTKRLIASEIARRLPEFAPRLPRFRSESRPRGLGIYEREAERMSIFDAASLAVTYFESQAKRSKVAAADA